MLLGVRKKILFHKIKFTRFSDAITNLPVAPEHLRAWLFWALIWTEK
jgi:hypothetical protein